jgi:hypothetical protein
MLLYPNWIQHSHGSGSNLGFGTWSVQVPELHGKSTIAVSNAVTRGQTVVRESEVEKVLLKCHGCPLNSLNSNNSIRNELIL